MVCESFQSRGFHTEGLLFKTCTEQTDVQDW